MTTRQMMAGISTHYCGTRLYNQNISRERAARVAEVVRSKQLTNLSQSDVYWDQVESIEYIGEQPTYDLTIPETHGKDLNYIEK